jgi:outer membrane protein assembly factor BamB
MDRERARPVLGAPARILALTFVAIAATVPGSEAAPANVPTEAGAPWPSMRHDRLNSGRTGLRGRYHRGDRPWALVTGKGIFSTPIVGRDETVYVGSADTWFYAVGRNGRPRWRYKTGEIVDSAGVLGRGGTVTFGSGDGFVYRLRGRPRGLSRERRTLWRFRATRPPAQGQLVNWWEGNVTMGPGGVLYAGNTGGAEYAIGSRGRRRWVFGTGNSVWSNAAIADDGAVFFGSLDLNVYALDSRGRLRWKRPTAGFVTSSPAIGPKGTVYIGSFDGALHALDPRTGADRWSYATNDHIYASPALGERSVYIASADGSVYAFDLRGVLRWRYDTGDTIRSSPVLGKAPRGSGRILYVGSANGELYALDARTGRRRWSFDTTPRDRELRDRDDLNSSPALGRRGVYIGGEHGRLVFVPYDWCLRARGDRRCNRTPGEAFGGHVQRLAFVTPGGTTRTSGPPEPLPAAGSLTARLLVRQVGETVDAALDPGARVTASPRFDFTAEPSGDGRFLHVVPTGFLAPGRRYALRIDGGWSGEGRSGRVASTIAFRTARVRRRGRPLHTRRARVSAFRLRRLAVPLPPILSSLNQIGFDSYDMAVGALDVSAPDAAGEGDVLLWAVSTKRGTGGSVVADRRGAFSFPLQGRYRHDSLLLSQRGLSLTFSFGDVPLRRFDLRMQLGRDMRARGASLYSEVFCPEVPNYGPALIAIGLCNRDLKLPASGTFTTGPYRGPANRRPAGVRIQSLVLKRPTATEAGSAVARLAGRPLAARGHAAAILLTSAQGGDVISLDYKKATSLSTRGGAIRAVRLGLPAGTELPARVKAYVIADVFPLAAREL